MLFENIQGIKLDRVLKIYNGNLPNLAFESIIRKI